MLTKIVILIIGAVSVSVSFKNLENNLKKTWKNNEFYSFRGIKYAEPPIGDLRFKAPVPVKTWNNMSDVFNQPLNEDGSDCPSPHASYNEDCLYLNVYTKSVNTTNLRPVIVFIHPGGFYVGSGRSENFGPEYLLEEDLVLVTFNYRLAFFGFTSIGSSEAIGNMGLKDQALVLQWVNEHIHHFGGDRNCVTVFGDSAGAMSVALHLVSPVSRHLFHRAFLMSGAILPQAKSPISQPNLVAKLARLIGCSELENSFECVKRSDTRTITDSLRKIFEFGWDNPVYPWLPIVEPKIEDEKQFISTDPMQLLQGGVFNRIPIMISTTKDEFSSSAMYLLEHRDLLHEWLTQFPRIGPICLQYDANETITAALYQRYVTYAPNDMTLFDETAQARNLFRSSKDVIIVSVSVNNRPIRDVGAEIRFAHSIKYTLTITNCFSDGLVNFPAYRFAEITKHFTDVYYMKFDFSGSHSGFKCNSTIDKNICAEIKSKRIVEHCDDLQYLFTSKQFPIVLDQSSAEGQIITKYTKLLYNFAKNGYPYYGPDIDVNKTKYNNEQTYMKFGSIFEIDAVPFKDAKLWDNLFPSIWDDNDDKSNTS